MEYTKNKSKPYVDIAKFFFAVNIVLLHYGVIGQLPFGALITAMVTRLAVPYFFVASGYFWARKMHGAAEPAEHKAITVGYCKRMGLKLLIFEPISIAIVLIECIIRKNLTAATWVSILQGILFYPLGSLWYIQALIVAVILLTPFVSRKKEHLSIIPALILYLVGALGNRYFFLTDDTILEYLFYRYDEIFITTRNGLFFGLPFVLLGCLISRFETYVLKPGAAQTRKLAVLFLLCWGLCFAEYRLVSPCPGHGDNAMYISYFLAVPLLFLLTAQADAPRWNTITLRNLSTSIYLIQRPIGIVVENVLIGCLDIHSVAWTAGIGIFVTSLVCAFAYRNKRQPFYGWLT